MYEEVIDKATLYCLYDILDMALVADPKVASAAKDVWDVSYVTDEIYIKTRYGISMAVFKSWVRDRKLFNYSWQCDASKRLEEADL